MADWWAVLTFKIFVHATFVSPSTTSFVIVTFLQVLKAASIKMTAFRDTTPCGFVKVNDVSEVLTGATHCPDDGESTHL
jgi:hypothetical protein